MTPTNLFQQFFEIRQTHCIQFYCANSRLPTLVFSTIEKDPLEVNNQVVVRNFPSLRNFTLKLISTAIVNCTHLQWIMCFTIVILSYLILKYTLLSQIYVLKRKSRDSFINRNRFEVLWVKKKSCLSNLINIISFLLYIFFFYFDTPDFQKVIFEQNLYVFFTSLYN